MILAGLAMSAALAQAATPDPVARPLSMTLICRGAESRTPMPAPRRMGGMSGMGGMGNMGGMNGMPRMGKGGRMNAPRAEKVSAQINLILEGEQAKLWLSDGLSFSGARTPPDGWHLLSDVVVDETSIRASAPFGMMGRTKLRIDRTNGEASLGGFQGVCHPAMTGPRVTRF